MSQQLCQSSGLSVAACNMLAAVNVDWAALWALILKEGPQVIKIVEALLPIFVSGGFSWPTLEQAILAILAILNPPKP